MQVDIPEMADYQPVELNGWIEVQVREIKESTSGKGVTLFLSVIDGPEYQDWEDEEIIHYVHLAVDDEDEKWKSKQWTSNIHNTFTALGVKNIAKFDTDTLVGATGRCRVTTKADKEGVVRTNITTWKTVK